MYKFILGFLFLFNPERAHYLSLDIFRFTLKIPLLNRLIKVLVGIRKNEAPLEFLGLKFKNCVGLAAGFDKDARYIHEFAAMGFGFIEVGTVTPLPQPGNEQPRLFRLISDKGIINRMGFNNLGVDPMIGRLKNRPEGIIIGGNIGKNKSTPNEEAVKDYEICFTKLYDYVDYFVVNVSSPNTPGLRELQEKEPLQKLLQHLLDIRKQYVENGKIKKPVLLKIAPDLTHSQLNDIIEIVKTIQLDGLVATNTTIGRKGLKTAAVEIERIGAGGLSGEPVEQISTEVIAYLHQQSKGSIPIIGVGGIHDAASAQRKFNAGAQLLQVYSGFIYEGPALISEIIEARKR
ncbi:MAG: quinone-dependent dihydroorotate dehydrogenase [Bacteroidia bacterium]|nr:quinone-dependent dihydroorotate dehydrogenase [Bacteroidia bacterium]MBP9181335.1 quinone-dependent dihydroorotate dehydrogenase [Bacteroidia bacterium]MBP9725571.1 quinone-dependent dihydroorotate dehydrogenase [Bacteroidia bacterium]